jgi:HPt (histidine-containing phosphotransfer) domain-containing protein
LSKPFERAAFYEMLTRFIQAGVADTQEAPPQVMRSSVDDTDPEMAALISEFVQGLPAKVRELCITAGSKDFSKIAALAHKLKGSSGMYGFPKLSAVAKTLEKASKEQQNELLEGALKELEHVVSSILERAPTPAQPESNPQP